MILFPAIDLKDGLAVRLEQGDMARATVFNRDPAAQAHVFETQGFRHLHVVDLDGAFAGKPMNGSAVERILASSSPITHVFAVHCETTSGVLNPVHEIGALAAKYGKGYLVDSMSAFGALPLDANAAHADAIAASSNKCIEGIPGLGFVICRKGALAATKGNATKIGRAHV